jgi:IS5 family transposase
MIDWAFLAQRFSAVCRVGPGQPPLPTRLVAGLFILKLMHNLYDEMLCERWAENPYFQYFCGEVVFRHDLPFDSLVADPLAPAAGRGANRGAAAGEPFGGASDRAIEIKDLERVVVNTTVQEKAIAHPTDARLTHRARIPSAPSVA